MQKIPTLFARDTNDRRYVTTEVTPGCEWVLAGEGTPTRKYDGTCVMYDGTAWWARREVKPGKTPPANYRPISTDETTGKTMGWEPVEQSSFAKPHASAVEVRHEWWEGTYELCGPKINGNPEGLDRHTLVRHTTAELAHVIVNPDEATWANQARLEEFLRHTNWEGLVWHHPDGRMAKLKRRDFR